MYYLIEYTLSWLDGSRAVSVFMVCVSATVTRLINRVEVLVSSVVLTRKLPVGAHMGRAQTQPVTHLGAHMS